MSSTKSIVILGMHRSLTSMVTGMLNQSGVFLGDRLIGASAANPLGHFEDEEVVALHRSYLERHGIKKWWSQVDTDTLEKEITNADFTHAVQSIIHRLSGPAVIGIKDPRMGFFVRLWHDLLPSPHYIVVVRHPVHCVDSLLKRSLAKAQIKWRPLLADRYFNLWEMTYASILSFLSEDIKYTVIHTPDDLHSSDVMSSLDRQLRIDWQLPIDPVDASSFYKPSLVSRYPRASTIDRIYQRRHTIRDRYEHILALQKTV